MLKKFLLILFLTISSFLIICCSSTKQELGEQPEAYTQIWQDVSYLTDSSNNNESITFSSNEEALVFMLADQKNKYAQLEKERDYYKEQAEQENIVYVAVSESSYNNPIDLIGINKIENTISVSSNYDFENAITVYTYQDGKIYDIFFTPLNITDIKLQPGEEIITTAIGDPNNWVVEQVSSVENGVVCMHIFIRPYNINISTDFEILTSYRNYYLRLYSTDKAQVAVQWRYPYSSEQTTNSTADMTSNTSSNSGITTLSNTILAPDLAAAVSNLNFNYEIKGNASWIPVRVFSDTQRTYIQFSNSFLSNTEAPIPYLKTGNADEELINFTAKGINYIIPIILSSNQKIILKTEKAEISISLVN